MRSTILPLLLLGTAGQLACRNDARSGDDVPHNADTTVTQRTVNDTTIVRHDTLIRVDTLKKLGAPVPDTGAARNAAPRPRRP